MLGGDGLDETLESSDLSLDLLLGLLATGLGWCVCLVLLAELCRAGEDGDELWHGRCLLEPVEEGGRRRVESAVLGVLTGPEPPFALEE